MCEKMDGGGGGGGEVEKKKEKEVESFSGHPSFPGFFSSYRHNPRESLGTGLVMWVQCMSASCSLLVIWEVEQFQDGGVEEGCLCDKTDRYRQMVL